MKSAPPVFSLNVNGKDHSVAALPDTPLLWILRDELGMKGTKFGCGKGQCGSCTVHMNSAPVRSCQLTIEMIGAMDGVKIVTIEGLSEFGDKRIQETWAKNNVPQCGYCQPGQIMSASALIRDNKKPSEKDIDDAMSGNICDAEPMHG